MTEEAENQKIVRCFLALWAYAYEVESKPMVSDLEYDEMAKAVDLTIDTDNPELDKFFRDCYTPDSGMWILKHPHFGRVRAIWLTIKDAY